MPLARRWTAFADDFNRADAADLGAQWDSGYVGADLLKIVSNRVRCTAAAAAATSTVNAVTLHRDQWAELTVPTLTAVGGVNLVTLLLRATIPPPEFATLEAGTDHYQKEDASGAILFESPISWYEFVLARNAGVFTSQINARINNVVVATATDTLTTWAAGDTLRAESVGNQHRLYRNTITLPILTLTYEHENLLDGRAGMSILDTGANDVEVDTFRAGYWLPPPVLMAQSVHRASSW